jgi:hypothetical protein
LEGKVSLADVKSGAIDIIDLMKINALMDMRAAAEKREYDKSK